LGLRDQANVTFSAFSLSPPRGRNKNGGCGLASSVKSWLAVRPSMPLASAARTRSVWRPSGYSSTQLGAGLGEQAFQDPL